MTVLCISFKSFFSLYTYVWRLYNNDCIYIFESYAVFQFSMSLLSIPTIDGIRIQKFFERSEGKTMKIALRMEWFKNVLFTFQLLVIKKFEVGAFLLSLTPPTLEWYLWNPHLGADSHCWLMKMSSCCIGKVKSSYSSVRNTLIWIFFSPTGLD